MDSFFKNVLTARVYEVARHTPLDKAKNLTEKLQNNIFLKREDLQPVFSFKIRGAYNKISHLTQEEKNRGIICASAGNHAQGVALSAKKLDIEATIVMPETTPEIKVKAVKQYGANVVLVGDNYSEAQEYCNKLVKETGATFIHPFDDPMVIAGQGTVGNELLQDCPDMDAVFVPIGGGGLIAGVASFIKALKPDVKIIGVEPEDSDAMLRSWKKEEREFLEKVGIFADGVAVKLVGEMTHQLTNKFVDDIITVSTDDICNSIKSIYEDTRAIMEPAGALAVAGIKKYIAEKKCVGLNLIAVNSGANMNFDRLQFVAERSLTGSNREALFSVTLPDCPGALKSFCENVVKGRNISEFNHRTKSEGEAHIFVGIVLQSEEERNEFQTSMDKHGYKYEDLTGNELAKTHIRYMIGGSSALVEEEVLYHFEFPERPEAMAEFLSKMSSNWNISLFHYRSHGSSFGRVLVGFDIKPDGMDKFQDFLERLNYSYTCETDNPAYKFFLY